MRTKMRIIKYHRIFKTLFIISVVASISLIIKRETDNVEVLNEGTTYLRNIPEADLSNHAASRVETTRRESSIHHAPARAVYTVPPWPRTKALLTWDDLQNKTLPAPCKAYFEETRLERKPEVWIFPRVARATVHQLCLVTHLTPSRLHMFEAMLQRWPGAVSAVLYLEPAEVNITKTKLLDIINERLDHITITIVYSQGKYYPVNYLRNVGLAHAHCEHVFMVDADFVSSVNLYETLLRLTADQGERHDGKEMWVVPAFEQFNRSDAPRDKQELLHLWDSKIVKPAHQKPQTRNSQGPTDFNKWRNSTMYYKAKYVEGFEPYVLLKKNKTPPFIDLFLERYGDKVSYFVELNARGFEFLILPDVFVVHLPHEKRETPNLYRDIGGCTGFIFKEMKKKAKELAKTPS